MKLAYSYRLDPDEAQRQALAQAFGCARVVYNDAIRLRRGMFDARQPFMGDAEIGWRVITFAKTTVERAWLNEVPAVVLQQALADQNRAWRNYFDSKSGKRRGRKIGKPKLGVFI